MTILDFLEAIAKPDGYLERGYTEDEIRKMLTPPIEYSTEQQIEKLFYYAKVKADPSDDVRTIKERFKKECNDDWCMYTVAIPLQADHYRSFSPWSVLRSAFKELDRRGSNLSSLEYWYQKTRW